MQDRSARKRTVLGSRIVALVAALLFATGVGAQRDDSGAVTTIDAERIDGVGDLEITARGSVELQRDGTKVFSDFLRYNQEFGRIDADGGVRLELDGDRFFGPRLRFDALMETGVFDQPTYLIQREQTARGKAERVDFLSRDLYHLTRSTYTTCAPGQEDWVVDTEELDLDYGISEARVHNGRLKFFDTTVFALPYAKLPLDKQRKSGFLALLLADLATRIRDGRALLLEHRPRAGCNDHADLHVETRRAAQGRLSLSRAHLWGRSAYRVSAGRPQYR